MKNIMAQSSHKHLTINNIYEMAMTDLKTYLDAVSHPVEMPPLDRQLLALMRKYNVQGAEDTKTLPKFREFFLAGMLVIGAAYFIGYQEEDDEEALDEKITARIFAAIVDGERVFHKHKPGNIMKPKAFEKIILPIIYRMSENYYNIWLEYFEGHNNQAVFHKNLNEALQNVFATWDQIGDSDADIG